MGEHIDKNTSKSLSGKYSQKILNIAKQSSTDAFKTASKGAIQNTAEVSGDFIDNKTADKSTKVWKNSQLLISMIRKYLKKIYISRRKTRNYWWTEIKVI